MIKKFVQSDWDKKMIGWHRANGSVDASHYLIELFQSFEGRIEKLQTDMTAADGVDCRMLQRIESLENVTDELAKLDNQWTERAFNIHIQGVASDIVSLKKSGYDLEVMLTGRVEQLEAENKSLRDDVNYLREKLLSKEEESKSPPFDIPQDSIYPDFKRYCEDYAIDLNDNMAISHAYMDYMKHLVDLGADCASPEVREEFLKKYAEYKQCRDKKSKGMNLEEQELNKKHNPDKKYVAAFEGNELHFLDDKGKTVFVVCKENPEIKLYPPKDNKKLKKEFGKKWGILYASPYTILVYYKIHLLHPPSFVLCNPLHHLKNETIFQDDFVSRLSGLVITLSTFEQALKEFKEKLPDDRYEILDSNDGSFFIKRKGTDSFKCYREIKNDN